MATEFEAHLRAAIDRIADATWQLNKFSKVQPWTTSESRFMAALGPDKVVVARCHSAGKYPVVHAFRRKHITSLEFADGVIHARLAGGETILLPVRASTPTTCSRHTEATQPHH